MSWFNRMWVQKYNENHDEQGRFAPGSSAYKELHSWSPSQDKARGQAKMQADDKRKAKLQRESDIQEEQDRNMTPQQRQSAFEGRKRHAERMRTDKKYRWLNS